jgi:TolB-like protein
MTTQRLVQFGDIELDIDRYGLRRAGQPVPLERLPMELLILLAVRNRQLVSRADIVKALWGANAFRDLDSGINTAIRKIRVALCEDLDQPRYLVTIKGKGYRLDGVEVAAVNATTHEMMAVRVLVLPFRNMTGDTSQDDYCDALADEASARIGAIDPQRVSAIARTTALRYRHTDKSIAEIARELSVDYVLEASMTCEGTRVRILADLVRCADQAQVWSGAVEPAAKGKLDIQSEVGTALAGLVVPVLVEHQGDAHARRAPVDPAAHDAYLRGRFYWARRVHFDSGFAAQHAVSGEDFARSHSYFEAAIERDPTYALGYVGLSNIYGSTAVHGFNPASEGFPKARAMALRALELDPDLPEAHQALAGVFYFFDWDWRRAEAEFLEALRLNPNYPEASRLYARLLLVVGRESEATAQFERAERIDPLAFEGSRIFGRVLAGKYNEVVQEYLNEGRGDRSPLVYQVLATAFEVEGMYKEAVDATIEALTRCNAHARAEQIRSAWQAGGFDGVLHWHLQDLLAREHKGYLSPLLLAEMYARLERPDEMFYWLERALADRSPRLFELRLNAWFKRYRTLGRFRKFEKRIGY